METCKEFEEKLPQRIEEVKKNVEKGDYICYRPNLVKVLKVEDDGVWISSEAESGVPVIKGPYGEEQKIDWEDVVEYNRDLCS